MLYEFAREVLDSAPECWECYRLARKTNEIRSRIRKVPARQWLRQYKNARFGFVMGNTAAKVMGVNPTTVAGKAIADFVDGIRTGASMTPESIKKQMKMLPKEERIVTQQMWDEFQDAMKALEREIAEAAEDAEPSEEEDVLDMSVFDDPGVLFYLGVEVPCWFEYGSSARTLLEQAKGGDFESLKKILNLDPYVLYDKKIRKSYWDVMFADNQVRKKQLLAAMGGKGAGKLTPAKIKKRLTALVFSQWRAVYNALQAFNAELVAKGMIQEPTSLTKLTIAELGRLQDTVDASKADGVDTGLPDEPRSYEKAVVREMKDWVPKS